MKLGTCGRLEDTRVGSRLKAGDCMGDFALCIVNSIIVERQEMRNEGVG
jgi:hypothetical protein